MALANVATRAERLIYRIAGLPVALSALLSHDSEADPLQSSFVWRYFHPQGAGEWSELIGGLFTWPLALVLGILWYTVRNGAIIRQRYERSIAAQIGDQIRLYFGAGVLAPWYYIFELHEGGGTERARSFIYRYETKPALFLLLKRRKGSPLNDKSRFADYCTARGIRCVEVVARLDAKTRPPVLPDRDLFVKPTTGRGGKGAERWDLVSPGVFAAPHDKRLRSEDLLERLVEQSRRTPLLVQPRLRPHPELADLTTGALPTVRVVTCLDENDHPEVIGAVFRMSIGDNRTVDNLHAGGIAANVSLNTAKLSQATNLGADARLGWLSAHPDTGRQIEGRVLPLWDETKRLAVAAHRAFNDRVVIGWDIAILEDGPIIIEGNGNSDMDILQRFMRAGLRHGRFGQLLAHHLRTRVPAVSNGFAPEPIAP